MKYNNLSGKTKNFSKEDKKKRANTIKSVYCDTMETKKP